MSIVEPEIFLFIAIGFFAQIVDGALGMAYGVLSSTFLASMGVPPAVASASVHVAEIFTTGASAASHAVYRNINKRLFFKLLLPGIIGGMLGAYVLTEIPMNIAKPVIAAYLALVGCIILYKAARFKHEIKDHPEVVAPLGLAGGFLDAIGGGGWGPIVTSNLIMRGSSPRETIGTVNAVEFFLTISVSAVFIAVMDFEFHKVVLGLLIGGVLAAPFAALMAKRLNVRVLMALVGALITATSLFSLGRALGFY